MVKIKDIAPVEWIKIQDAVPHKWYINNIGRILFYMGIGEFLLFSETAGITVIHIDTMDKKQLFREFDINKSEVSIVVK